MQLWALSWPPFSSQLIFLLLALIDKLRIVSVGYSDGFFTHSQCVFDRAVVVLHIHIRGTYGNNGRADANDGHFTVFVHHGNIHTPPLLLALFALMVPLFILKLLL